MRSQKPVKGGRRRVTTYVVTFLETEVERLARRFDVSRSFVRAVMIADQLGLSERQEQYLSSNVKHFRRRKGDRRRA